MKFKWSNAGDGATKSKLRLHGECNGHQRVSYIGAVFQNSPDEWSAFSLELMEHPVLEAVDNAVYKTRLGAMRALTKAFTIAWMGATQEERDSVWD